MRAEDRLAPMSSHAADPLVLIIIAIPIPDAHAISLSRTDAATEPESDTESEHTSKYEPNTTTQIHWRRVRVPAGHHPG